jgi:hypothetical protein
MRQFLLGVVAVALILVAGPTARAQLGGGVRVPIPNGTSSALGFMQFLGNGGPDPAAVGIQFQILGRSCPFKGRVRITGVIRNVGDSTSRFGHVWLLENGRLVAERWYQSLAPGQLFTVSYDRNWDTSPHAEGEFPPTYWLMVPVADDGPRDTDDSYLGNNELKRSGAGINAMFRRLQNVLSPESRYGQLRQ